jgi:hypothetical protein
MGMAVVVGGMVVPVMMSMMIGVVVVMMVMGMTVAECG